MTDFNAPGAGGPSSGLRRLRSLRDPDLGLFLAVGAIGLLVRLAYVMPFAAHPIGRMPWVDEGAYWTRAREIAAGRWLPERPFYQDPLYPYALAVLSSVVGTDVDRLRIASACVGALTPMIIFGAARRGLGRAEAIVAGLAATVYGPLVFSDGLIEKESPGALVSAAALWLTARAMAGPPALAIPAGLAWGLLALLRSNALLIGPLGAIVLSLSRAAGQGEPPRARLPRAAAFLLGFATALTPVAAVNAYVGARHEWLPVTWQLGPNFYIGNGPEATGTYEAPAFVTANPAHEADDFAAEAERRMGRELSPAEVSRFWLEEGLQTWRERPGRSLAMLAHKLGLVLHDFEIPDSHDIGFVRVVAAPALGLAFLGFGWVAPWAAAGLGRSDRTPFRWFLVLTTGAALFSTAAFFVVGRYRIPWAPGLLMLAAAGVVDIARRLRAGRWREVAWRAALLMVPAAVLAWRPIDDPAPGRWGHQLIGLGLAHALAGQIDPTIDALDQARALGAGPTARVEELLADGPLRLALNDITISNIRRRRVLQPERESDLALARWLRQRPEERPGARRLIDRWLQVAPDDPVALRESAAWRLGIADDPGARAVAATELIRATRGPIVDPSAAVLLALLTRDPRILPDHRSAALARAILARPR